MIWAFSDRYTEAIFKHEYVSKHHTLTIERIGGIL